MTKITIMYAVNTLGYIGKDNELPWHSKADLQRFKKLTTGNVVIMGRNTWESLPSKPLKDRINIVVTSSDIPGVTTFPNLPDAIKEAKKLGKDIFLIGGKRIFEEGMEYANRIDITWIKDDTIGDIIFKPDIEHLLWVQKKYKTFDDGYYEVYERYQ